MSEPLDSEALAAAQERIIGLLHFALVEGGALFLGSAEGIGLDSLSGPVLERYLGQRRAAGYVGYRSVKALRPLLDYLAPLKMLTVRSKAPCSRRATSSSSPPATSR